MRRAGIDPGSGHLAVVITEGDVVPSQEDLDRLSTLNPEQAGELAAERDLLRLHVEPKTFEVGRLVKRDKPKEAKNGFILTHRRVVNYDDAQKVALEVLAYLQEHSVERAIIEWIDNVHMGDGVGKGGAGAIGTSLVRTMLVGALVNEKLEQAGIKVARVVAATWRGRVARTAAPKGRGRAELGPAVAARLLGWTEHDAKRFSRPAKGLEHERDAAGCAIWDVLPPVEKRRPAGAGAPRRPRRPAAPRPKVAPPALSEMSIFKGESPEILQQLLAMPRRGRSGAPRELRPSEEKRRREVEERRAASGGRGRGRPRFVSS
jgi:hypothetical protein